MNDSFFHQVPFIRKTIWPHRKMIIASFMLSGISTALGMIQPYFAKIFIDNVFLAHDFQLLAPLMGLFAALLIFSFVIRSINSYLYTLYSSKILFQMRETIFGLLQKLPLNYFAKSKIGDIYSRISSDISDIQTLAIETIPHFFFNILTFILTAAILIWLNWKMALMSFCFIPAAIEVARRMRPKLINLSNSVAQNNADIAHFLFENLSSVSFIRTFGAEQAVCEKLKEKHSRMIQYLIKYRVLGAVSGAVSMISILINSLVVFGFGGYLLMKGQVSIGDIVAFSIYQGRVFSPLQGLMDGFLSMQKSIVSLRRVREIMDIEPVSGQDKGHIILADDVFQGGICFDHVFFSYDGKQLALKDISFQIPAGRITALVGPSGSGKTTICHLLVKLIVPNSGNIAIDGVNIQDIKTDWLRKQISLVSQDIMLFHDSILENIRFSNPEADADQIEAAARAACIHDYIESLPDGYHTVVGDRGIRLSGGQKQRISIARSVLMNPKILILDEATAFLDSSVEDRLKHTIQSLMEGKTIIIVSHRFSTIQHADKIIALTTQGIIYEGPVDGFDRIS